MKLWNRLVLGSLVLALALGVCVSPAAAASKKKKSEKETKREAKHEESATSTRKHPINGANMNGRPGYFFADTANSPDKGQIMGAAHVVFYSAGSLLNIPFGAAYGLTDQLQLHASTAFYSVGGGSGLSNLTFGGKYAFKHVSPGLDVAAGLDFAVGPLSNAGYSTFSFDPYGVVTYNFVDGFQLNGQLGVYVPGGYSIDNPLYGFFPGEPKTFSYTPPAYLQFNAGAAYPFDHELTGIAELAVNGQGSGDTPLVVGIRTGKDVQFQALGGLDLAGTVGVIIGGGIVLVSQ